MVFCCINQHFNKSGNIWCTECNSLIAGALINDYRVVSYIGKGSTSDVYLAEQNSLHERKVVIKILQRSCSVEYVDNIRSEAKLLASLSHPYIVPIFSFGAIHERSMFTTNYVPYLVMQFAEQGSLAELFERQGSRPWSLDRVVTLAREVAEALDYAHSLNILHRDVKPANLLQIGSHVLLSDFSVATLIDADASHLSTGLAGSPAYMAPEVWGMHPGRYSDQYALAITCFFLLTDNYPFKKNESSSLYEWQHLHCYTTPTPLGEYRADLPPSVNVVLQKAMTKNPHGRYPTVQDFAIDLLRASQESTQQLVKHSISVLSPLTRFRSVPGDVHAYEKELIELQPAGVSLADAVDTEPFSIPTRPVLTRQASPDWEGMNKSLLPEVHTETAKVLRSKNRWPWSALALNVCIYFMLIAEYTLIAGRLSFSFKPLLTLFPVLLVGPLLAVLFKRISLTTLSWSLCCGILFGMTNALLSLVTCIIWYSLLLTVQLRGITDGSPSGFFSPTPLFLADPRVVLLLLLALWVSVIGGAVIGIFNMQGEGVTRIFHQ